MYSQLPEPLLDESRSTVTHVFERNAIFFCFIQEALESREARMLATE